MSRAYLLLVVSLFGGWFMEPAIGAGNGGVEVTMSAEELAGTVRQLGEPATEMAALRRLIKFADMFLYNGHLGLVANDPADDELRRKATRAVHEHRSVESVGRALASEDRDIRYWAVMGFEFAHERRGPWLTLLPRLQAIAASRQEDAGMRSKAIEKLQYYEQAAAFLRGLQDAPGETNPWVLMVLLRFNSQTPEWRARWYARAVENLAHKDAEVRKLWLQVIWGNVANPSTAPMWRVQADPKLVESLEQIARAGSDPEKEAAEGALSAFKK